MKNNLMKFLKAHGFSLIIILMFSIALKISAHFLIILTFPVLVILYLILGVLVEYIQEKIHAKDKKTDTGVKTPDPQIKKPQIRKEPVTAEKQRVVTELSDRTRIENHGRLEHQEQIVREEKTEKVVNSFSDFTSNAPDENTVVTRHVPPLPLDADFTGYSAKQENRPKDPTKVFMAPIKPIKKSVPDAEPVAAVEPVPAAEPVPDAEPEDTKTAEPAQDFLTVTDTIFNRYKERNSNREALEEKSKESETVSKLFYASPVRNDQSGEEVADLIEDIEKLLDDGNSEPLQTEEPIISEEPVQPEEPVIFEEPVKPEEPDEPIKQNIETRDHVHVDQSKIEALFSHEVKSQKSSGLFRKKERKEETVRYEEPPQPEEKEKKYIKPSLDILHASPSSSARESDINPDDDPRAQKLIETLSSFGVGAKVTGVMRGPAVTRYEVQPNPGVKVSRIVSLSDDISLNLAATGVRIEAPIPGKEAVGIEVPNKDTEMVFLRDVLESREFAEASSKLTFAIGKDIAGNNIVWDIAKMPHLLIAGATGSGKSVCINTIIASILYKASPDEVKMIMVDPKIVELGIYNGIPHLLVPVVNNPKKAAAALAWAVNEMEYRYTVFSQYNVRDMKSYNAVCRTREDIKAMPHILIIIDELADLMMVAAKEIEDSIIRLAQKARAAGLHIVIATQRPSVDVITGLIKANIPSRIAFAVTSQIDSRTILDGAGAEKLLGRGDMLFHPVGISKALRIQGAFVSDGEIEMLVDTIKNSFGDVEYSREIQETMEAKVRDQSVQAGSVGLSGDSDDNDDGDADMIESAAELALEYKQISTSFLQRKLKLGYSRASRIIDTLEEQGLISSADGSKPRQLLITREEWEARNS